MRKFIIRLDDACEKMDTAKWNEIEAILDKYSVCPLVGVIPDCQDKMMDKYPIDCNFWDKVQVWQKKGWAIAMHGCTHVYVTDSGGINPVNKRSEFAGLPLAMQRDKIAAGVKIMREHGFEPTVFFAPSHTFDFNTIEALKLESNIRIISDTIANKPYTKYGMIFVPQQCGSVRNLPLDTITFCYHPNMMNIQDFRILDDFLNKKT